MEKKKRKVHEIIKTTLIILFIYLVFVLYLLLLNNRFENLDNNSYTQTGHNKTISIQIGK